MEERIMNFDDLKKGAEDALKKTVDGAKDLADKAADKTKEIAGSEVAQNIKKGTEDVLGIYFLFIFLKFFVIFYEIWYN